MYLYHQTAHEQEAGTGLNNSKTLSSSRCTFPRAVQEMNISFHVYSSDIMKLVTYLFLTAGSFCVNWSNTSANTVISEKYRGKVKTDTPFISVVPSSSHFMFLCWGHVFHLTQISWKEIYCSLLSVIYHYTTVHLVILMVPNYNCNSWVAWSKLNVTDVCLAQMAQCVCVRARVCVWGHVFHCMM